MVTPAFLHVVAGVLMREQTVLIAQRPLHKSQGGLWEFPGGKVEDNESALQALIRELKEEIGVTISPSDATFLIRLFNSYPEEKEVQLDVFLIKAWEETITACEGQSLRFISLHELPSSSQFSFLPGVDKILSCLTSYA